MHVSSYACDNNNQPIEELQNLINNIESDATHGF